MGFTNYYFIETADDPSVKPTAQPIAERQVAGVLIRQTSSTKARFVAQPPNCLTLIA